MNVQKLAAIKAYRRVNNLEVTWCYQNGPKS